MIVTDIKKVPRKNKYDIFVDGEKAFCLSDVGVINGGIKIGVELSEDFFNGTLKELTNADVFETLLNILGQTSLTEYIARQKLKQKGYADDSVDFAVEKAVGYGYIDDKKYAESYVEYATSKSKMHIIAELRKKGVDKKSYEEALDEYDEEEACLNAMRSSVKRKLDDEEQNKLFAKFYARGFPLSTIKNAYSALSSELTEGDIC